MKSAQAIQTEMANKTIIERSSQSQRKWPAATLRAAALVGEIHDDATDDELKESIGALALVMLDLSIRDQVTVPYGYAVKSLESEMADHYDPLPGLVISVGLLARAVEQDDRGHRILAIAQVMLFLDKFVKATFPHDSLLSILNAAWESLQTPEKSDVEQR